jgi:hypothetical protein
MSIPREPTLACTTCNAIVPLSQTLHGETGPICERCHAEIEAELAAYAASVEANDALGHMLFTSAPSIARKRRTRAEVPAPAEAEDDDQDVRAPTFPHPLDYVAALGAALPFFFTYQTSGSSSVDGFVNVEYHHNWTALGGGILALTSGLLSLTLLSKTPTRSRQTRLVASLGLAAVGAFHLLFHSGFLF